MRAFAKASFDMCVERSLSVRGRDAIHARGDPGRRGDVPARRPSQRCSRQVRGHGMTERSNRRLDQIAVSPGANIAIHFATLPSF